MRAFIAVPLPERAKSEAAELIERLRKALAFGGPFVRWVDAEDLHFTLKFLGDKTPSSQEFLDRASNRLREVLHNFEPVPLEWNRIDAFPSERNPRAICLTPARRSCRALERLARRVESVFGPMGFAPEREEFRAHMTLGRIETRKGAQALSAVIRSHARFCPAPSTLDRVSFVENRLNAGKGSRYVERFVEPLVAPPPSPPPPASSPSE